MMIFTNSMVVIPSSRLYNISVLDNKIEIRYEGGDLIDVEGTMYSKLEVVTIHYESKDACNKALRQFYKACANNQNAFYFGGSDNVKESVIEKKNE